MIPTYNRSLYLRRLLDYYQNVGCAYPIVIADSSVSGSLRANQTLVAALHNNLDITYRVFNAEIPVSDKLITAIEEISTSYVVLCADDDFIVPRTLTKCVAFLEARSDYAIAHGTAMHFTREQHSNGPYSVGGYPQRSVGHSEPHERLLNHLQSYSTTFYSVHRRTNYLNNLRVMDSIQSDHGFKEILLSCLDMVQGKAISLPDLYMVRQSHQDRTVYASQTIANIPTADSFSQQYAAMRNAIADLLVENSDLSFEECQACVNEGYQSYLKRFMTVPCACMTSETNLSMAVKYIEALLPTLPFAVLSILSGHLPLSQSLRKTYHNLREERARQQQSALLRKLLRSRSPLSADFLPIHQQILKSWANENMVSTTS